MQKELEGWRKENADHADALRREERCALEKELYNSFVAVLIYVWSTYVCVCVFLYIIVVLFNAFVFLCM